MKTTVSAFVLFFILFCNSYSQYPNIIIHPSTVVVQLEPVIVRSPIDPQVLFASSYTKRIDSLFFSEGVYVSTNGGLTWRGNDTCAGAPINNHGGDPGPIIDKNGIFIMTHLGNNLSGMFGNVSTDMGLTWSGSTLIASQNQEKGSPGTDEISTSPYYGRTYVAWSRGALPFNILLSYTTNSGSNWSPVTSIQTPPANHQSWGAVVTVGPGGKVYVAWATTNTSITEDNIGVSSSTDGGVTWTAQESAFPVNGIKTATFQPWNVRVNGYPSIDIDNTGGSRNGWVYIVSAEINHAPAGSDADIVFHRSTNGGQSWSPTGIRVNQDPFNNGRSQFYPVITVDNGGGINVIYYDNRNGPDSVEIYLSRSTNGGDNWTDYKVSNHKFRPNTAATFGQGIWGDHIGVTNSGGKIFPVWMDDFGRVPHVFQVWTAVIDIATIGIQRLGSEVPVKFSLKQNFPNPFNPATRILFDIPNGETEANQVQLKIYDLNGKEVETLVNGIMGPGSYETEWDASKHASGVYYYRLLSGSFSQTRKMVLVK